MTFVYPYGSSLTCQRPGIPVLGSGYLSYPLNQPLSAFYAGKKVIRLGFPSYMVKGAALGKLVVVGSAHIFEDAWVEEQENSKLQEVIFKWLLEDGFALDSIDAESPDLSDYHYVPNTEQLSDRLRCCLQDTEELPKEFTQLFDDSLFRFDTSLIPMAVQLYEDLGVKHDPLTLMTPQFEVPLPPLQPAVFPPILNDPPPPPLELFDLDEQFASEKVRLAHLTNMCNDDDVEYYIKEAGEILGIGNKLKADKRGAAHILEFVLQRIVSWKKLNQEPPIDL